MASGASYCTRALRAKSRLKRVDSCHTSPTTLSWWSWLTKLTICSPQPGVPTPKWTTVNSS